ncbi:hypothetical protein [Methanolobus chelungpuianus]|uniref:hypothetical protein n=1 Tax=Methanolobus chelungpuianus TaxID=502115 RepID=UPI0021139E10|nr:hypothetical protein [Methanolobus chelungpuianus]
MNTKAISLFLAVIMLMSIGTYFFAGPLSKQSNNQNDASQAPGFDTIPGTKVNHQLNSLQDGLSMTPEGVTVASYVDYSRVYGTPLEVLAPNITDVYSVYGSMIVKRYAAYNNTEDFGFEAHVIYPEVINFEYMLAEQPYNGYYLLSRNGQIYNIVGSPMLLGPQDSLQQVIDVASGNLESSRDFERIMPYIEAGAEYQMLTSADTVAGQHYMEFRAADEGNTYTRTEVFVEPQQSLLENISALEANSTERGLAYNVTSYDSDNVTKVMITTNATNFYNLALEQLR